METNYARVTLDDLINAGSITATVTLLPPLTSIADNSFGIQSFGFNQLGTDTLSVATDFSLPTNWTAHNPGGNQDGFGAFDYVVDTSGFSKQKKSVSFFLCYQQSSN